MSIDRFDELVDHWTLLEDERPLVDIRRGPTKLGFALVLKFYTLHGRFPRGRAEFDDETIAFVAKQLRTDASDLGLYDWDGRTAEAHRAEIRQHLGFRKFAVEDAAKFTDWLVDNVCQAERHPEQVSSEFLAHCREEQVEPPTDGRTERIVKTIFTARYLRDRDLQRQINAGLNVSEAWNAGNGVIYFGKGGGIASNRRDEQELSVLCLRILQTALVYVNTLMIQHVLADPAWDDVLTDTDLRGLTPLFWSHITPYGEVRLDMNRRLSLD